MNILILNGPNLNLLGIREVDVYGSASYDALLSHLNTVSTSLGLRITVKQSNHEGVLIDALHDAHKDQCDGIILNAGALSHYSYALRDAIAAIDVPVLEVHLSDLPSRKESFRHHSVLHDVVQAVFMGRGFDSYTDALNYFHKR